MPVHDVSQQFATPTLGIATQCVCVCAWAYGGPVAESVHATFATTYMNSRRPLPWDMRFRTLNHVRSFNAAAVRANGKLKMEQFDYV